LFDLEKGPLRGLVQTTTAWVDANHELIVSGAREYLDDVADNLPEIVDTGLKIGKVVAAFYAWSMAIKGVKLAIDTYAMGATVIGSVTSATRIAASAMGLYNTELQMAGNGLEAMRARFNAGALSQAVNGVTSSLGKAGLLGAALGVGVAFGLWVREVLHTDQVISDLMLKIRGLETERAKKLPGGQEELAGGVVVDSKTGRWVNRDESDPLFVAKERLYKKHIEKRLLRDGRGAFGLDQNNMTKAPVTGNKSMEVGAWRQFATGNITPIVSPQEQTARTVTETTNNTQVEIAVKAEPGTSAVLKKKPKGPIKMAMPSTGTP
jgi:hypothetical protein